MRKKLILKNVTGITCFLLIIGMVSAVYATVGGQNTIIMSDGLQLTSYIDMWKAGAIYYMNGYVFCGPSAPNMSISPDGVIADYRFWSYYSGRKTHRYENSYCPADNENGGYYYYLGDKNIGLKCDYAEAKIIACNSFISATDVDTN